MLSAKINYKGVEYPQNADASANTGILKNIGAGVIGLTTVGVANKIIRKPINKVLLRNFKEASNILSEDTIEILNKAGEKILVDSGLDKKGVKIYRTKLPPKISKAISKMEKDIEVVPTKFLR